MDRFWVCVTVSVWRPTTVTHACGGLAQKPDAQALAPTADAIEDGRRVAAKGNGTACRRRAKPGRQRHRHWKGTAEPSSVEEGPQPIRLRSAARSDAAFGLPVKPARLRRGAVVTMKATYPQPRPLQRPVAVDKSLSRSPLRTCGSVLDRQHQTRCARGEATAPVKACVYVDNRRSGTGSRLAACPRFPIRRGSRVRLRQGAGSFKPLVR